MIPDDARPVRRLLHTKGLTAQTGPGVVVTKGTTVTRKAPGDGHYTTTDEAGRVHRFKINKGDVYPDEAEFVAEEAAPEESAEPQQTAKQQQAKRGPSETAQAKGASETA